MQTWQLQDAKARFSEVVKRAVKEGPQEITVHGESTAVVLSRTEYDKLKKPAKRKQSFAAFMRASPLYGLDIDLTRDKKPYVDKQIFED
jgi:antitoxin Phd